MATILLTGLGIILLWRLMMLGASVTVTHSVAGDFAATGGKTYVDSFAAKCLPASVPAAQPGTLTTRTDNVTGTLTMTNPSHGIITGQRFDLYWSAGQCYHCTAGTVAGTSVPFVVTGGGSNLPAATTACVAGIATQVTFPITGNNITVLSCSGPQQGYFVFDASTTDDLAILIGAFNVSAADCYVWNSGSVNADPLASDVLTSVWMSHSYVTAPVTAMQVGVLAH